jgi:chromate reductase
MSNEVHISGISGSLRVGSYNTALLNVAAEHLPREATLEILSLTSIPLYNADVEAIGFPESVNLLRATLAAADALLIATPEYNSSIPGVLKNALDWLSRPPKPPLDRKPVAIIGASTGIFGTSRAQTHLRLVLSHTNCFVVNKPEVLVTQAAAKFDERGRLIDDTALNLMQDLLSALVEWTRRLRS